MYEDISYTTESGSVSAHTVVVYALSTCGFCKQALNWLREKNVTFSFIYLDQIEFAKKEEVKKRLFDEHQKRILFPFAIIDNTTVLAGFNKQDWEEKILDEARS